MAKVSIDGVEYDSDTMSQESRQQLEMLMMTEQKIRHANALQASLVTMSAPTLGELIE
jgi:hypothetical protein